MTPLADHIAWPSASVLITGGTGSFGHHMVGRLLRHHHPRRMIVFSRDELKQHQMRQPYPDTGDSPMRYFIGDVRDRDRLNRAFRGVDIVIHAAALKQVPACEYNPLEAVKTNVLGTANVIDAAIDAGVRRVLVLSSDKAANPINLYGATKLVAEKLAVQANTYAGGVGTAVSAVRYGNVVGSRGSVVPLFEQQKATGRVPITDPRMTRFWMTLDQAVAFVLQCLERMQGGEIFVPKIPSMRVVDLAQAIAPEAELEVVGIRPGEKLHEALIPEDEARNTTEHDTYFTILPMHHDWDPAAYHERSGGQPCPDGFRYSSDTNTQWLSIEQLRTMLGRPEALQQAAA
jgi:UDP-N-acetylglucosamine 4,6-dehydratase